MAFDYENDCETGTISCDLDGCHKEDRFDGGFSACIDQAKDDGWRVLYRDGDYAHLCPTHKDEQI